MLTVLFCVLVVFQVHAVEDYGRDFVTAFPENIARYYPFNLTTYLKITALHDDTHFSVTFNRTYISNGTLGRGQTRTVYLSAGFEVYALSRSLRSVRITSDSDITVFSFSSRDTSIQTNVVPPVGKLGKVYRIPSPNYTDIILMLNNYSVPDQSGPPGSSGQTYKSFRLLIINAEDKNNVVTVTQQQSGQGTRATSFTLSPFELIQMQSSDSLLKVTASANVSVLLTHPCLDTYLCKCSMVVHQLRPTNLLGDSFLVPPITISNQSRMFSTSDQSVQLQYGYPPVSGSQTLDPGSSDDLPFYFLLRNGFSNVSASQPVSLKLIHPGSLTDLIPASMFSACYLAHATSRNRSQALLIVETDQAPHTRFDSGNFTPTVVWNAINGTGYSWAVVKLYPFTTYVIWHPFSKMAVYVFERMVTGVSYGGPATSINEEPDQSGCLVVPSVLDVGNQPVSWQVSRQYCAAEGGYLASPSCAEFQRSMTLKLKEAGARGQAWIGLRRSLLTTEWYWQNGRDFDFSNWDDEQPGDPRSGMCASVSMEQNGNYTWNSMQCCSSLKPVCYIPAQYLRITNPFA